VFDIKKASDLFQAGYAETLRYIEENPSILELKNSGEKPLSA